MPEIKVSVIIPVCNVENYVRHTIESALAQTMREIEVIIVDDGSTDSSPEIIDYYAAQDDRIIAIHKPNGGYGKACNVGIDKARGEFVAILESDDFIDTEMYERLYEYAKQLGAEVVKAPFKDCFAKDVTKPYPHNDYLTRNMPRGRLYSLAECPCQLATHQSIWSGIYLKSYLDEHAIRFDEHPGAGHVDIKFCVESLVYSKKLAWLDTPFYNYRVEREGSSTATYNLNENTTRYGEMHEFFKRFEGEFRASAPQLVAREAVGLYRYYKNNPFEDAGFQAMSALFNDFTEEEILRAPIISQADKQAVLLCRNDPEEAARRIRKKQAAANKPAPKKEAASKPAAAPAKQPVGELAATWAYRASVLAMFLTVVVLFAGTPGQPSVIAIALGVVAVLLALVALLLAARQLVRRIKRDK